jgi:GWxTD domain-containing protein
MTRKSVSSFFALILLALPLGALGREGLPAGLKDLSPFFRDWLEKDVAYIIAPKEREVFLRLDNDRERTAFIEAFWKQRDPTPGTPANEFKDEHYKRMAYADQYFGRDTTRPGWTTDRGRIYILLGPPIDISRFEGESYVHPTQIWSYQGREDYGLPAYFNIVFFRRNGQGEFVLYSPAEDGPISLLVNYRGDPTSVESAYQQLYKFNARLAEVSVSLIPDEGFAFGQPSLASENLIGHVFAIPEKAVDTKYADALLKFKDSIELEYTANYIGSQSLAGVILDDSGVFFLHYSIQPEKLSVFSFKERYSVNFDVNGIVTGPDGVVVFQYDKTYPLNFSEDQIQDVRKTAVLIEDAIPLVPGTYKFSLLLKNTVSKEFTSFEKEIVIPDPADSAFGISPLLLGYQQKKMPPEPRQIKPFRVGDVQISCQPDRTFAAKESLVAFFQMFNLPEDLRQTGRLTFVFERQGKEFERSEAVLKDLPARNVIREFPLKDFPPDYYRLVVSVVDVRNRIAVSAGADFAVSSSSDISRPWVVAKVMPPGDHSMYAYLLGGQLVKKGDLGGGEKLLAKACEENPRMLEYALGYADLLIRKKEYARAGEILLPFSGDSGENGRVFSLLGGCSQGLGRFEEAIKYYKAFLARAGTNLAILNAVGQCYFELGNFEEAGIAWKKSLEINPDQKEIRDLLARLKKKASDDPRSGLSRQGG